MTVHKCPCCAYPLMRHFQHHQISWFCAHCWALMPVFAEGKTTFNRNLGD